MAITISEITASSTHLSGNPIKVKATTSAIPSGATEYMILLKIVSVDDVLFGGPFVSAIAPDASLEAEFEISGWVNQEIEKDLTWPIPDVYGSRWHGFESLAYDVQLVPGERYIDSNGDLVETYGSTWGTLFIVSGQLNEYLLAKLNSASSSWYAWYCTGGRWFSFMPLSQKVNAYQPVKLWWKSPADGAYVLKVKGYYTDGSTETYTGNPDLYVGVLFESDVNPADCGLTISSATKRLTYYEVWMEGTPNVETRTFVIDWTYHEENWYLFTDNEIGGIECIWLSGAVKYQPSASRSVSKRPQRSGEGIKQRTRYVAAKSLRRWTINTGFKPRAEMEALLMLLDSEYMWLAIPPEGGSTDISLYTLTPVLVTSSELPLFDNSADLFSIDIEFEEAY